jgi:P-type E1-E2 ATPase
MIEIDIPGFRALRLSQLALDYNGTLAGDGALLPGVASRIERLATSLSVHVLTGDTFGTAAAQLDGLPCHVVLLPTEGQDTAKALIVRDLGADQTAAVGNGRNDRQMLETAALGIAILGCEGAATETVMAANLVTGSILDALELLLNPSRLIASLRR